MIKKALEKTEEAIKNGQSRDNANIGHNFQQYFLWQTVLLIKSPGENHRLCHVILKIYHFELVVLGTR